MFFSTCISLSVLLSDNVKNYRKFWMSLDTLHFDILIRKLDWRVNQFKIIYLFI